MKPYILLNSAMTVDGKIATRNSSLSISGKEDWIRVHKLRQEFDAVMVGINTVLTDDPRLSVHKIDSDTKDNPIRIVIDSKARTPLDARVLNDEAKTIIIVSESADIENVNRLSEKCQIILAGKDSVNLKEAMSKLYDLGIKSILQEGGATLNFSMLEEKLIDRISVCVGSIILGGKDSKTLVDGVGFDKDNTICLELKNHSVIDNDILLEYDVLYD